jgi:hypothetical protein
MKDFMDMAMNIISRKRILDSGNEASFLNHLSCLSYTCDNRIKKLQFSFLFST